jgi:hypothetical protein
MKRIMAVYDLDLFYARRFADVMNQKENIPFAVMAFTSLERLRQYAGGHSIEILLVSSQVNMDEICDLGIGQVITLTEGEKKEGDKDYPSVYKYQSSSDIIREVMACYSAGDEPDGAEHGRAASVIGVYSPVGRCLKTSFALTLGQLMAADRRVLYVTLEDYSGLASMTGEEYKSDFSDILYYFSQGNLNFMRLSGIVHSIGNMDYIPPARYPEDLAHIPAEQMAELIRKLAADCGYEIIILDVGNYGHQAAPILSVCQIVYMPIKEDGISSAKIWEFEAYAEKGGRIHLFCPVGCPFAGSYKALDIKEEILKPFSYHPSSPHRAGRPAAGHNKCSGHDLNPLLPVQKNCHARHHFNVSRSYHAKQVERKQAQKNHHSSGCRRPCLCASSCCQKIPKSGQNSRLYKHVRNLPCFPVRNCRRCQTCVQDPL